MRLKSEIVKKILFTKQAEKKYKKLPKEIQLRADK